MLKGGGGGDEVVGGGACHLRPPPASCAAARVCVPHPLPATGRSPCSWRFGAATMCEYTRPEFEDGMAALGCDSVEALRGVLPMLRAELADPAKFRQIYQFAYLFCRWG